MCGILGVTHPSDLPLLQRMAGLIRHRGPDDYGEYIDGDTHIGLAMRRLSIIDLAGGRQPMCNEDQSIWVVFNGEIYNAIELRSRLIGRGHKFRTDHSDTEVLVHLYEDEAEEMLGYLNGMFAFAIYDRNRDQLFCARDRAGIKPLYYAHTGEHFAFASELKSLRVLPWVGTSLNTQALYDYMSLQFIPAPATILEGVSKLPAGHFLTLQRVENRLCLKRYWALAPKADESRSLNDWCEVVREKVTEAVRLQVQSDVPVACSLSGGLDSTAIVSLLTREGRDRIATYTVGFTNSDANYSTDLFLARAAAHHWKTDHHEVLVDCGDLLDELPRMVWHMDEPYGGGLPSWYVFRAISAHFKVALTGTGGDELFGNYGKWRLHERPWWYAHLRSVRDAYRWRAPRAILDGFRHGQGHRFHRYLLDAVKDSIVFDRSVIADCRPTERHLAKLWEGMGSDVDARGRVAAMDFQLQLPEEFLAVTDRFSMAHSVEARVPFLDHELIELVFSIPGGVRTANDDPKYLLRRLLRGLVPSEILKAPKQGFTFPLTAWTRGRLKDVIGDLLSPSALRQDGFFSEKCWYKMIEPHLRGTVDYTQQIWTLLMFHLWYRATRDDAPERASAAPSAGLVMKDQICA
jgi:asparagine synthase (glutamine-hydrolysing)